MSDDDLLCICMSLTRSEIKKAIQDGDRTIDALKASVMCCTGCGTCEPRVQKLIDEVSASSTIDTNSTKNNEEKSA